jgi:putative ABC transport system substrate-binding protein
MTIMNFPRRRFLHLAAGAALLQTVSRVASYAQNLQKTYRIGLLSPTAGPSANDAAFLQGLKEIGYIEKQNFVLETRYAAGKFELLPTLALELVQAKVDLILAGNYRALLAAKATTSSVPLIMTLGADPVAFGVVDSLVHPGGNITGLTEVTPELTPKRVTLFKQIMPSLRRMAILSQPGMLRTETFDQVVKQARETAQSLGLQLEFVEVRAIADLDAAFDGMIKAGIEALVVLQSPMFNQQTERLADLANTHRLPTMYESGGFAAAGGLISYGADFSDIYRRAATYVDRLLKGAKPADLPVEAPIKFDLVINRKTAKTLGLEMPQALLRQADQVID